MDELTQKRMAKKEKDGTLLSLMEDIQYNCVTLNIIHNNLLVNSQTLMFVRIIEEENEYLKQKYEMYCHLSDGDTGHCYIDKNLLNKYKLTSVVDEFHYIFSYTINS
jgi:phage tail sheath gpL-like